MLEAECRAAGVRIQTNVNVEQRIERRWLSVCARTKRVSGRALVVATGGLSIPKMGATGFGYDLARQFGLKIVEPRPALVPLTFNQDDAAHFCDLAGVSAEVVASIGAQSFREKMLITHRGLSGPAILQISSYWKPGQPVSLDLAPEHELTAELRDPKARRDLAAAELLSAPRCPIAWLSAGLTCILRRAGAILRSTNWNGSHNWQITPAGTEGYAKAEVTAGGVDTNELSAKTMESRKVPGLYFIGEVVDVTGHLGGFNFQWAWASGFSAGQAA